MSKRQIICLLGVWVIIFLFLGFPSSWDKIIAVISGLAIIAIAYNTAPDQKANPDKANGETFLENNPNK